MQRSKIPDCTECTVFEDNPQEFAEEEICPTCQHKTYRPNGVLTLLLGKLKLIEAGAPVRRSELTDPQWEALGILRAERARMIADEMKN